MNRYEALDWALDALATLVADDEDDYEPIRVYGYQKECMEEAIDILIEMKKEL